MRNPFVRGPKEKAISEAFAGALEREFGTAAIAEKFAPRERLLGSEMKAGSPLPNDDSGQSPGFGVPGYAYADQKKEPFRGSGLTSVTAAPSTPIGAVVVGMGKNMLRAIDAYVAAQRALGQAVEQERQALKIMDAAAQAVQMLAGDKALTSGEHELIKQAFESYDANREVPAPGWIANPTKPVELSKPKLSDYSDEVLAAKLLHMPWGFPYTIDEVQTERQRRVNLAKAQVKMTTPSAKRKQTRAESLAKIAEAKQARRDLLTDPDGE